MNAIRGTWLSGRIILEEPADWPDGTSVIVEPAAPKPSLGVRDKDWPADPTAIAEHLALMDQIQPLDMTAAEEAAWQAARQAQKDYDTANFEQRTRRIERTFQ